MSELATDGPHDPVSHYDRVTEAWTLLLGDDLHYGVFDRDGESLPSATRRLTNLMIEAAEIEAGDSVLDVGCGTGAPACYLAAELGARVTGISTSREGIDAARERAAADGLGELVSFELRDGTDTGLEEGSFDRVWVLESSHLIHERERLIAECARLLRPGGRLALCDIVLRREMPFAEIRRLRRPLGLLRAAFGSARLEPLPRYRELVIGRGLVVHREDDLTAATRPTLAAWRANAGRHRNRVSALLGERGLQQFLEACGVLERFWDDGTLGYGLLAASKPQL